MSLRILIAFLAPVLLFGQLSSNTVTVSASRGPDATTPDEAVFNIVVKSGYQQGLDDIVAALAGSGITIANLGGVTSPSVIFDPLASLIGPAASLGWSFQWTVPLARVKETTASLTSLQKTIAQRNPNLSLTFSLSYAQISAQQSQRCDVGSLIADARTQAQTTAAAANLTAAAIVGVEGAISQGVSACWLNVTFALGYQGQPGPHTITITASRTSNPPPDEVLLALSVTSALTAGLDDIVSALAGAGISGARFSGVSTRTSYTFGPQPQSQSLLEWSFGLTASLPKLKDTLAKVAAAQQAIAKQNSGLSLAFYLQGIQASPQLPPVCHEADLVTDAKAQAQRVAAAAGVSAGPIVSLSRGTVTVPTVAPRVAMLIGDFTAAAWPVFHGSTSVPDPGCSMSVQFQLY